MAKHILKSAPLLEWALARRPEPAGAEARLLLVAKPFCGGMLLALGSGLEGTEDGFAAAKTARTILERYGKEPVSSLVKRCHNSLLMSPGVVLGLASFDAAHALLSWVSVGTVQGWVWEARPGKPPAREALPSVQGIVGYHLPKFGEKRLAFGLGSYLVLALDGLEGNLALPIEPVESAEILANNLLAAVGRRWTAVLVARHARHPGEGP